MTALDRAEDWFRQLLAAERNHRNNAMLRLIYYAGLRPEELTAIRWQDVRAIGGNQGLLTLPSGGELLLPSHCWSHLLYLRSPQTQARSLIFMSRHGGSLSPARVSGIVRNAARRVGLTFPCTAQQLWDCHAQSAVERGAPIALIAATLRTGQNLGRYTGQTSAVYLG